MKNKRLLKSIIYFPVRIILFVYYLMESIYLQFKRTGIILEDEKTNENGLETDDSDLLSSCPYSLIIKNTTDSVKKAVIFGYSKNYFRNNYGSDEGVIIETLQTNVSYNQLLIQSAITPFEIGCIRLVSNNIDNIKGRMYHIDYWDADGCTLHIAAGIPYDDDQPQKHITQEIFVSKEEHKKNNEYINSIPFEDRISGKVKYDDYRPYIKINLNSSLTFHILPNSEMAIMIFPISKNYYGKIKKYSLFNDNPIQNLIFSKKSNQK